MPNYYFIISLVLKNIFIYLYNCTNVLKIFRTYILQTLLRLLLRENIICFININNRCTRLLHTNEYVF